MSTESMSRNYKKIHVDIVDHDLGKVIKFQNLVASSTEEFTAVSQGSKMIPSVPSSVNENLEKFEYHILDIQACHIIIIFFATAFGFRHLIYNTILQKVAIDI